MKQDFCDGKYTVISEAGKLDALRNGQPWQDLTGNNLVYWMLVEVGRLKEVEAGLLRELRAAQRVLAHIPGNDELLADIDSALAEVVS